MPLKPSKNYPRPPTFSRREDYSDRLLVLYWLLLAAGIIVAAMVCWHLGLFHVLIHSDVSYLSVVIMLVFAAASVHAGVTMFRLSGELASVRRAGESPDLWIAEHRAPGDHPSSPTLFEQHVRNLFLRQGAGVDGDLSREQTRLLDALHEKIQRPSRFGWMLADLMIKMGLLGTVIGFILMLGAVTGVESVDLSNIQKLLTGMGAGMRVALFTTLSGLVAGSLLAIQYFLVERVGDELHSSIAEVSEVHMLPRVSGVVPRESV